MNKFKKLLSLILALCVLAVFMPAANMEELSEDDSALYVEAEVPEVEFTLGDDDEDYNTDSGLIIESEGDDEAEALDVVPDVIEMYDSADGWQTGVTLVSVEEISGGTLKLAWTADPAANFYSVYEVIDNKGTWKMTTDALEATLSGVAAGEHTYSIRPRELQSGGTLGNYSNRITLTVAGATGDWKKGLVLNSVEQVAEGSVKLAWTPETPANYYSVYEVVDNKGVWKMTTEATEATLTGVADGEHTYSIRPREQKSGGDLGDYSNRKTLTVGAAAGDWKKGVVLTSVEQVAEGSVKLAWTATTPANYYSVYEVVDNKGVWKMTTDALEATLTGIADGAHTYSIRPREQKSGGTLGDYSNRLAVTVGDMEGFRLVSVEEISGGTLKLAWNADPNANYYSVYEIIDNKGTWKLTTDALEATLSGVAAGEHTYSIRPREQQSGGNLGNYSNRITLTVAGATGDWKKGLVLNSVEQVAEGSVKLAWTPETPANYYSVYEVVNNKGVWKMTTNALEAVLEDVDAGEHTYSIRPREAKSGGTLGDYSNRVTVTITNAGDWKKGVTLVSVEQTAEGVIKLAWTAEPAANYYSVYEIVDNKGTWKMTTDATEAILEGVAEGEHTYSIRPREAKSGGTLGDYSNRVNVTVVPMSDWKKGVTLDTVEQTGDGIVTLAWSVETPANYYSVYEIVNNKGVWKMTTDATEAVLEGVEEGEHTYSIRPREAKSGGTLGDYSNRVSVTVEPANTEIVVDDVVYDRKDEALYVKAYNGDAESLTIPETVQGYTVVEIGECAFENKTCLVAIDLPDTIQIIGRRAFAGCVNLSSMS